MMNCSEPPAAKQGLKVAIFDPWCLVPYYTIALARALTECGAHVTVISIGYDLDPECFARAGLRNDPGLFDLLAWYRIRSAALRRTLKLGQGVVNLIALAIRLLFRRPEVIHIQQLRLMQAGLPLEEWFLRFARFLGCRLVYTVHNLLPHDTHGRHRARYGCLYRRMDGLICHSEDARNRMIEDFGASPARLWVIPHGPLFQPAAGWNAPAASAGNGQCVILWQGFIRPYKGIEFLLDAWREVAMSRCEGARLIIAGTGELTYVQTLRERASASGIAGSVEFRCRFLETAEMQDLYRSADVVVYPYREITTSGALLTGIANAKAIIATALPAFSELLRNGENALLVEYGDVPALTHALRRLIADSALRDRIAACAGKLNDALAWPGIAAKTLVCYERILATGGFGTRSA